MKFIARVTCDISGSETVFFIDKEGFASMNIDYYDKRFLFDSIKSCIYGVCKCISREDYWKGCTNIRFKISKRSNQ